jgi:hypothetical protein
MCGVLLAPWPNAAAAAGWGHLAQAAGLALRLQQRQDVACTTHQPKRKTSITIENTWNRYGADVGQYGMCSDCTSSDGIWAQLLDGGDRGCTGGVAAWADGHATAAYKELHAVRQHRCSKQHLKLRP